MGVLMQEADTYYAARESRLFVIEYVDPVSDDKKEMSLAGAV